MKTLWTTTLHYSDRGVTIFPSSPSVMLQVKDSLREDPRYRSVKHEEREMLFNEYISELKAAEEEKQRESKARKEEQVS